MNEDRSRYIPALRYEWLTDFYDVVMDRMINETSFKQALVQQAQMAKSHRELDLGCGTATLTLLIKQAYPDAHVTGLDGDPKALEIARGKVARSGLAITVHQGGKAQ